MTRRFYHFLNVHYYRSMAITKFFPTGARYSFPCFDNIKMKAKFNITLGHHEKLISISNMQLLGTKRM